MEATTLNDILAIENDANILKFKCPSTGHVLWSLIRNIFIRFVISDLVYSDAPIISTKRPNRTLADYGVLLRTFAHNASKFGHLRGPILISSTASHIKTEGGYFNRLSDPFAMIFPEKTVTLESLFPGDWYWPFPRHNERILFDSPTLAISRIWGKLSVSKSHKRTAEDLVDFVAQRALNILGWHLSDERRAYLVSTMSTRMASLPLEKYLYTRLFKQTGAQILIREEGCYGGSSVMTATAKELGIITAEYQHGSISLGHDAYNFAPLIRSSDDYKRNLPDYFLGYGRWWNQQINAPLIKINMGNPQMDVWRSNLSHFSRNTTTKKDILVLGDGIETKKYLDLCRTISKKLRSGLRLVFRPHPLERSFFKGLGFDSQGTQYDGFVVKWDTSIKDAIYSAHAVISEVSTGLFEAVGISNKILVWDTPKARFCYPDLPFERVSDPEDLIQKINDKTSGQVSPSLAESLWEPNWKDNYMSFIKDMIYNI